MPPVPKPIPADLWQRLAILDARCDYSITRHDDVADVTPEKIRPRRRIHQIRIRIRQTDAQFARVGYNFDEFVDAVAPALADALAEAIGKAEARGWHLPRSGG